MRMPHFLRRVFGRGRSRDGTRRTRGQSAPPRDSMRRMARLYESRTQEDIRDRLLAASMVKNQLKRVGSADDIGCGRSLKVTRSERPITQEEYNRRTHDDDEQSDECLVCLNARPTMRTFPCNHKVTCKNCFKTYLAFHCIRVGDLQFPPCIYCRTPVKDAQWKRDLDVMVVEERLNETSTREDESVEETYEPLNYPSMVHPPQRPETFEGKVNNMDHYKERVRCPSPTLIFGYDDSSYKPMERPVRRR